MDAAMQTGSRISFTKGVLYKATFRPTLLTDCGY